MVNKSFWNGKRVFVTGHTGFKGGWLSLWLHQMGAIVKGYALNPPTTPSLFEEANIAELIESEIGDIRNLEKIKKSIIEFEPEILIHMAAQPLVRLSYDDPIETYDVNVMGTAKVLEAARYCDSIKAIISVTTDKCYENNEWAWGYRESDPMGGYDPYSSSKGCVELVTAAYRRSFLTENNVGIASVRAGNVIGGGDWADDRLIPDILNAFENKQSVTIRNPLATRPWQHVLEPLSGYLVLAEALYKEPLQFSEAWNFGPNEYDVKPVEWIVNRMSEKWEGTEWQLDKGLNPHESSYLKLDISKAKQKLNWKPTWDLDTTIDKIITWHRSWLDNKNMQEQSILEINNFMEQLNDFNN